MIPEATTQPGAEDRAAPRRAKRSKARSASKKQKARQDSSLLRSKAKNNNKFTLRVKQRPACRIYFLVGFVVASVRQPRLVVDIISTLILSVVDLEKEEQNGRAEPSRAEPPCEPAAYSKHVAAHGRCYYDTPKFDLQPAGRARCIGKKTVVSYQAAKQASEG